MSRVKRCDRYLPQRSASVRYFSPKALERLVVDPPSESPKKKEKKKFDDLLIAVLVLDKTIESAAGEEQVRAAADSVMLRASQIDGFSGPGTYFSEHFIRDRFVKLQATCPGDELTHMSDTQDKLCDDFKAMFQTVHGFIEFLERLQLPWTPRIDQGRLRYVLCMMKKAAGQEKEETLFDVAQRYLSPFETDDGQSSVELPIEQEDLSITSHSHGEEGNASEEGICCSSAAVTAVPETHGTMDGNPKRIEQLNEKFIASVKRNLTPLEDVQALFPEGIPIQAITRIGHKCYVYRTERLPSETRGRIFHGPAGFARQVKVTKRHLEELRQPLKFPQFYRMRFIQIGYGSKNPTSTAAPTADPPTVEQSTKSAVEPAPSMDVRLDLENATQSRGTQSVFTNDGSSYCVVGAIFNAFHDTPDIQATLADAFSDKEKAFMWHTEVGPWLHQSGLAAQEGLKLSESSQYYDVVAKSAAGTSDKHLVCLRLGNGRPPRDSS